MILALMLLLSSAQAEWIPTGCNSPIPGKVNFFVSTYLHRGPIDHGMGTEYEFYLTLVYDFLSSPMIVYALTTAKNLGPLHGQQEAEQWLIRTDRERTRAMSRRLYVDASFTGDEDSDSVVEIQTP